MEQAVSNIKFISRGKKHYIKVDNQEEVELRMTNQVVGGKFSEIVQCIKEAMVLLPEYRDLLYSLLKGEKRDISVESEWHRIVGFAETYIDSKKIDFDSFYDSKKVTKRTISFKGEDLRKLAVASVIMKLLSPVYFVSNPEFSLDLGVKNEIKSRIIDYCKDVFDKIFRVVSTNISRGQFADEYMWKFVEVFVLETTVPSHILSVYSFLVNKILAVLDITTNPISFFTSIITESTKWLMIASYNEKIIYTESFTSADMFSDVSDYDLLEKFCFYDLLHRISNKGLEYLVEIMKQNELSNLSSLRTAKTLDKELETLVYEKISDRQNRVLQLHPVQLKLVLPLLCREYKLPYKMLQTASPRLITLCGVSLYKECEIVQKYTNLKRYLIAVPKEESIVTYRKSHYVFRNIDLIINNDNLRIFGGFKSKVLTHSYLSDIVGTLFYYRTKLVSIIDDKQLGIDTSKLEEEVVGLFSEL